MSESPLRPKALQLLAHVSGKDVLTLKPEAQLQVDLGLDSPKALELLMDLEEEFGFEISDEEAAKLETVQDILDLVERSVG